MDMKEDGQGSGNKGGDDEHAIDMIWMFLDPQTKVSEILGQKRLFWVLVDVDY